MKLSARSEDPDATQSPAVLGYVVVVFSGPGQAAVLTCSDLMDRDAANYEATAWRAAAAKAASNRRYEVCPVMRGALSCSS